jgi:serine phosphatase RsbU (regulator of sigma subunit)
MASADLTQDGSPERGRVLLVDDDPQICAVFRKALERRGHTVFEARDGPMALTTAREIGPEIILLDLNLPSMGGLELLNHFSQQCPDVPVIIVSGTGKMDDAIEALRRGAWDFLTKPLPGSSVLTHTVESNLQRHRLLHLNKKIRRELAFQHARIREDEEAGRRIQNRLFPPRDWSLGAYRFQHRVLSSMLLSGDFVDYFRVDDRFAVFYCADVSGHGVSSALVTVLVKSLISKYLEHYKDPSDRMILEPDRLLTQLNTELYREELGKHLTLFYGALDMQTNRLCYASAGHYPPPLLFSPGQDCAIEHATMAVGLFPLASYQSETIQLPDEFRLVVFSDGALDALSLPTPEAKLGYLRTLSTVDALRGFVDSAELNHPLPDDLTVLCITRGALP